MHVLDFWSNEVTAYTNLLAKAVAAVASAEAQLATARAKQGDAVAVVAQVQKDIAALRAKIATDGPADATADALALRALIAKGRDAAGLTLLYGGFGIKARGSLDRAHTELDRAVQKLAAAAAAKDQATKQDATLTAWKNELAAAPLSTLTSDAHDKLNGLNGSTERASAKAILDAYFPAATCIVQSALPARRTAFNNIQKHFGDAADGTRAALVAHLGAASAGPDNAVRAAQINFDLAWSELAHHVRTAKEDLDRAVALYASVAAMPSALPALIQADILTASAYGTKASAALADEQDRNAALATASDDRYKLDTDRIAAESVDPTSSAVDSTVTTDITTVNSSTTTLLTKDTTFVAAGGKKADLDSWIAALPDDVVRAVLAMAEADEILTRLAALTTSTLVTAVANADSALANALLAAAKSDRTTIYLEDALAQRLSWLAKAAQGRLDNLFSAVRGDR